MVGKLNADAEEPGCPAPHSHPVQKEGVVAGGGVVYLFLLRAARARSQLTTLTTNNEESNKKYKYNYKHPKRPLPGREPKRRIGISNWDEAGAGDRATDLL